MIAPRWPHHALQLTLTRRPHMASRLPRWVKIYLAFLFALLTASASANAGDKQHGTLTFTGNKIVFQSGQTKEPLGTDLALGTTVSGLTIIDYKVMMQVTGDKETDVSQLIVAFSPTEKVALTKDTPVEVIRVREGSTFKWLLGGK